MRLDLSRFLHLTLLLFIAALLFHQTLYKFHRTSFTSKPRRWERLVLEDGSGEVILDRDIQDLWSEPLRQWDHQREVLGFIHVVKSGGTSLEASLGTSSTQDGCMPRCVGKHVTTFRSCPGLMPSLCGGHFDWSRVEETENLGIGVAPLILLRDPVRRALSHFAFAQRWPGTRHHRIGNLTLSTFLQDRAAMLESRQVWFDGQGSVAWLAGTHTGGIVQNVPDATAEEKDQLGLDWSYMLNTAIENLHKSLWLGLLENLDESMELLRHQTGLDIFEHTLNRNTGSGVNITEAQLEFFKQLMPMDRYLYEYAKKLHEYRYRRFKGTLDGWEDPTLNLPKVIAGCKSTRHTLDCPDYNIHYKVEIVNR